MATSKPKPKLDSVDSYITAHDVFAVMEAAKLCGRLGTIKAKVDPKELAASIKAAKAVFTKAERLAKG